MVHGYRQADLRLRIDPAPQVRRRGPRHPRECSVCDYHLRNLRCMVALSATEEALSGHLRALRSHCRVAEEIG